MNYPNIKADIDLCYRQLFEICRGERKEAVMRIPQTEKDFDIQFSAAFDELKAHRKAKAEGRLVELPCKVGDTIYFVDKYRGDIYKKAWVDGIGLHWTNQEDIGDFIPLSIIGKTVFLTREEAETALRGEK